MFDNVYTPFFAELCGSGCKGKYWRGLRSHAHLGTESAITPVRVVFYETFNIGSLNWTELSRLSPI